MMFDILILCYLAIGAGLGLWRGAYASLVVMLSAYIPMLVLIYYYDHIAGYISDVLSNSQDGLTAGLAGLGAFSGLIAVAGVFGAVIFGTRILLRILSVGEISKADRMVGAVIGFFFHNITATLLFFLIYTAIPAVTADFVRGSYWLKALRPMHFAAYPLYLDLLEYRTARLSRSIAENGFASTLVGGITLNDINQGLGFDNPSLAETGKALQKLVETIDLQEMNQLLDQAKDQNLSPEEIDRAITQEQAARLSVIESQLAQ